MSKSEATPGPWTVDPRVDGRSRGFIRCQKMTGPYGLAVARVTYTGRSIAEATANAALIAAAPAMRDALRDAHRMLDALAGGYPDIGADTRVSRVRHAARAALALADGGGR